MDLLWKRKTENRLKDAILSLWATGDKEMQDYFKYLLSEQQIIAELSRNQSEIAAKLIANLQAK